MNYKIRLKDTPYYLGKSHKVLQFHDILRKILTRTRHQGMQMTEYYEEDGFAYLKIEKVN